MKKMIFVFLTSHWLTTWRAEGMLKGKKGFIPTVHAKNF